MKVVLCGYMGSGKSEVGKLVSKRLNIPFSELDDLVEQAEGKSISEIFQENGEIYFRKQESKHLRDRLFSIENEVISLGGGTPCYGNNLQLIQETKATLIYLKMEVKKLTERLFSEKSTRPMIAHYTEKFELEEFVRKHLFERNHFYLQSDFIIKVGDKSVQEIADEIVMALN